MKTQQKQQMKYLSREDKGRDIFEKGRVSRNPSGWRVISQNDTSKSYLIKLKKSNLICSCNDFQNRQNKCKHVYAVDIFQKKKINDKPKINEDNPTYPQNWSAYNKAQTTEKISFMRLLREICNTTGQPLYLFGRPTLPFSDMLFCSVMKVYTGFSLRRFTSDMNIAREVGLIDIVPSYSTVSNFMNREEIKIILENLIKSSAAPLNGIETAFAVDSSGFSTSRFARWFDYKWGKEKKYKVWLKAHINSGVKTNIITAVNITEGYSNDSKELKSLVEQTAENFNMSEVSGDKAYSSKNNLQTIKEHGAIPFIPFKSNVSGKAVGSMLWKKMYHYFMFNNEEFMQHYNKRSNVETCFHMIKSKFGATISSKNFTAQVNELLMKVLCHNLVCLIHEICELDITVDFSTGTIE